MKPKSRILIVDDDQSLVLVAQRVLEKAGFHVLTAFDGWSGLQKVKEGNFDLIILDISMPGLNGYEVCRQLHRDPNTTRIPVLFLSGKGVLDGRKGDPDRGLKEVIKAFDCGGLDFVNKPVKADVLVDRVKAALWLPRDGSGSAKRWADIKRRTIIESRSNGESVLIADNAEDTRNIICSKLTELGYDCTVAAGGYSVLAQLRERPFDLVLMNVEMPNQLGLDVLRETVVYYPDTSIIALTPTDDVQMAVGLLTAGSCDYITKPIDLNLLIVKVRSVLKTRKLILENRSYQANINKKVKAELERVRRSLLEFVISLASTIEDKDEHTSGHSKRVSEAAVAIAQKFGMEPDRVEQIRIAGLVHDIGKIGIEEPTLNNKKQLAKVEEHQVVEHSVIGERILTSAVEDREILKLVRHHQERYDGEGFPDGLSAQEIPLGARILKVADAYDALICGRRPSRRTMTPQLAFNEIKEQAYTHFDPVVIYIFSKVLEVKCESSRNDRKEAVSA